MQEHHQVWKFFIESQQWGTIRNFQKNSARSFVGKLSVVAMLGVLLLCATLGLNVGSAHAQSRATCSGGDHTYVVVSGDTLGGIANRFGTNWGILASHNHIANPNLIYPNQVICIPGSGTINNAVHVSTSNVPLQTASAPTSTVATRVATSTSVGNSNVFPYGSCTWWADQRYFQLHGVFVPWTTQSDAWEWTARAYQFGWHVSSSPSVGSIIDLQPWVQGAYGLGHVAVVEQVLSNGQVIASNMSWGAYPWQVTYVQFAPGPGVTFISQ